MHTPAVCPAARPPSGRFCVLGRQWSHRRAPWAPARTMGSLFCPRLAAESLRAGTAVEERARLMSLNVVVSDPLVSDTKICRRRAAAVGRRLCSCKNGRCAQRPAVSHLVSTQGRSIRAVGSHAWKPGFPVPPALRAFLSPCPDSLRKPMQGRKAGKKWFLRSAGVVLVRTSRLCAPCAPVPLRSIS